MRDMFICVLTALFVVVQCETIHFTNSPSHLIGSKNITSYKLLVKNSDPITIIEANKEISNRPRNKFQNKFYANDRVDVNVDDNADTPLNDFHVKLLANMGGSHYMHSANTQNVRGTVGLTISGGPSGPPFNSNFQQKSDQNDDADVDASNISAKKVVYSPILLKKFMKEYSEKLKNADFSTKNEIQRIHEKIQQQSSNDDKSGSSDLPLEFDKSIEELEQKYNLNGYRDSYDDDRRKRPSDPFKDKDGWVTLDAIPWSSSSVAKWHPHGNDNGNEDDTRRRPSIAAVRPTNSRPSQFPPHDDFRDEFYDRPKPQSYPDRDRPSVYSAWIKPQAMSTMNPASSVSSPSSSSSSYNPNGRPRPQPYRFGEQTSFGATKFHNRDHFSNRPWGNSDDIITDDRPSNFPSESHSHKYHDSDHYHSAASNFHSSYQAAPSEGNGEWVLISTTKGYQVPGGNRRQQGNRALSPPDAQSSVVVNVPQSVRMHKALKLTVLPAEDPAKNSTFSTDTKRKPTTIIHGGMVEIDATHTSIDDDVRATLLAQKKKLTAASTAAVKIPVNAPAKTPVKTSSTENKNRKLLKVFTTKSGQDKSTEILAAVGAGLVPATMAFLAPIVLGRKRRSITTTPTDRPSRFQSNTYYPLM